MSDIVNELNAQLGLGGKKLYLPAELERRGYKVVKLIGEGAYGQALLVNTRGNLPPNSKPTPPSPSSNANARPSSGAPGLLPVWDIKDPYSLPEFIIVKHINMSNYTRTERAAARNEINFLKRLSHEHIVRYIDAYEETPATTPSAPAKGVVGAAAHAPRSHSVGGPVGEHLWISMEYADGGDLERKMKRGAATSGVYKRLEEKDILNLFCQIVSAVGYMHCQKVLHRDLKPQNVFLSSQSNGNHVKIGDFGISKSLAHTKAMAHTVCGTPYYFSPELCKGKPYNAGSDVWSLGVMFYEMLTRRMPFDAKTMPQLMTAICSGHLVRRPEFNDQTWSLVQMMLTRDAMKRPDCGAILMHPALKGIATQQQLAGVYGAALPAHMLASRRGSGASIDSTKDGNDAKVPLPPLTPSRAVSPSASPSPKPSRSPSKERDNATPQPRVACPQAPTPRSNGNIHEVTPTLGDRKEKEKGPKDDASILGLYRACSELGHLRQKNGHMLFVNDNKNQKDGGGGLLPSVAGAAGVAGKPSALRPHNFSPPVVLPSRLRANRDAFSKEDDRSIALLPKNISPTCDQRPSDGRSRSPSAGSAQARTPPTGSISPHLCPPLGQRAAINPTPNANVTDGKHENLSLPNVSPNGLNYTHIFTSEKAMLPPPLTRLPICPSRHIHHSHCVEGGANSAATGPSDGKVVILGGAKDVHSSVESTASSATTASNDSDFVLGGGGGGDGKSKAQRAQEAAVARARIVAKNEQYVHEQIKAGKGIGGY